MKQKIAVLVAVLDSQWATTEAVFARLKSRAADAALTEAETVLNAYLLHSLYGAVEELLKQVASTFENQVEEAAQYHAELLRRMTLDIPGFRPAFLSADSYRGLQELRRFRHVFRHAYDFQLDPTRVAALLSTAIELQETLTDDKARFRAFLMQLLEESSDSGSEGR
jgi:uncharacterized tellurite resistance protein B-like protein